MAHMTHSQFAEKYLDVRSKSGQEWLSICPYHNDTSPSFSFNIRKGVFLCYSCNAKGRTQDLALHLKVAGGINSQVEVKAEEVKDRIKKLFGDREYEHLLDMKPSQQTLVRFTLGDVRHKEEWAKRGITNPEVFNAFKIGYSPLDNYLAIPIWGNDGEYEGYIQRTLNPVAPDNPKYKYPAGFPISQRLFGSWQARCLGMTDRVKKLAVVEGSIDALSMWEVGIPAVALFGARMSTAQSKIIKALDPRIIVVMTDQDTAGAQADLSIRTALKGSGIVIKRGQWDRTDGKDPAELTTQKRIEIFHEAR
jgi:DNA primase